MGEKIMDLSILIARIVAVVYPSAALGAVFGSDHYRRVLNDMFKNTALTYFVGFTAVILGCLIVNYHNRWVTDWTSLITILGWLALLKGILIISFPRFIQRYSKPMIEGKGLLFFRYVTASVGLLFGYFGFAH